MITAKGDASAAVKAQNMSQKQQLENHFTYTDADEEMATSTPTPGIHVPAASHAATQRQSQFFAVDCSSLDKQHTQGS